MNLLDLTYCDACRARSAAATRAMDDMNKVIAAHDLRRVIDRIFAFDEVAGQDAARRPASPTEGGRLGRQIGHSTPGCTAA